SVGWGGSRHDSASTEISGRVLGSESRSSRRGYLAFVDQAAHGTWLRSALPPGHPGSYGSDQSTAENLPDGRACVTRGAASTAASEPPSSSSPRSTRRAVRAAARPSGESLAQAARARSHEGPPWSGRRSSR